MTFLFKNSFENFNFRYSYLKKKIFFKEKKKINISFFFRNSLYLKQRKAISNNFSDFFYIYGFNHRLFKFIYVSLGVSNKFFKHFFLHKKYFHYFKLFKFNQKIRFFFFLLKSELGEFPIRKVKFLFKILPLTNCLKSWLFRLNLPQNGQRTKTNAKTCKLNTFLKFRIDDKYEEIEEVVRFFF